MFAIHGAQVTKFPILESLQKVSDLFAFEHPLLTHLQNPQGANYLELWCDEDKSGHRTLLFAVEQTALEAYRNREITLRRLLQTAREGVAYLIERIRKGKKTVVTAVPTDNIPAEYLPSKDSYYEV